MNKYPAVQEIVVIDDVQRLALHLWSYLSDSPGFGIGDSSNSPKKSAFWAGEVPRALETPDGRFRVWWIPAGDMRVLEVHLESLVSKIENIGLAPFFLVDVRGPNLAPNTLQQEHLNAGFDRPYAFYSFRDTVRKVGQLFQIEDLSDQIFLVSSYERGARRIESSTLRIYEKTSSTFQLIKFRLDQRHDSGLPPLNDDCISPTHFLITGAGFEYRETPETSTSPLGLSRTSELIKRALDQLELQPTDPTTGFPIPRIFTNGPESESKQARDLKAAAKSSNLDAYWDILLTLLLAKIEDAESDKTLHRRFTKIRASEKEYALRGAFRTALLSEDWGYLRQALDAAILPFRVWLTTNYTRFADRAIHATSTSEGQEPPRPPWRIISTSNEAGQHLRTLLHGSEPASVKGRFFFKLHGDITHLTTMAIAGHDKEHYSPLSFFVDSLHLVYTTAVQHIERLLVREEKRGVETVFWHVVGHSLNDELLIDLMHRMARVGSSRHTFLIVGLDLFRESENRKNAISFLHDLLEGKKEGHQMILVEATAQRYLAWLSTRHLLRRSWEPAELHQDLQLQFKTALRSKWISGDD